MRLDDLDQSSNVEDRRGQSGGGGGFGLPIGGGGLGIGTIIILGLIGWALGIDPRVLIGGAEILSGGSSTQQQQPAPRQTRTGSPSDDMGVFVAKVLGSTETQWKAVFQEGGKTYRPPILVMYNGRTRRRLRRGAERDGSVLLPERPEDLSRHLVLPASSRTASAAAPARPASSPRPM